MTTKALLAEYNERAAAVGAKQLKTWKGSKAQLQAKLDALPAPSKKTPKRETNGVSVADLAREAGKNPKVVRAKLRRLYANGDTNAALPKPIDKSRWVFDESDREAIAELVG